MILLIVLAMLGACIPILQKKIRAQRRRIQLATQLRGSLQSMVHALRVGVGFQQALEYAARESEAPLVLEWRRLLQEIQVGGTLSEAVCHFEQRVGIPEAGWFAAAVQITQSTGGSLAEVLELLAQTLQQKQALREKVSAITAQGKASGVILAALPFLLLAALALIVPQMVRPMFNTFLGQSMLAGVCVSVSIGGVIIWKIVNIEVD